MRKDVGKSRYARKCFKLMASYKHYRLLKLLFKEISNSISCLFEDENDIKNCDKKMIEC